MTQLSYFGVTGTWEPSSNEGFITGVVSFTMLIENNGVLAAPTLDNPAVVVPAVIRSFIVNNTLVPVSLLANTAALNLTGTLYYRADFSDVYYNEPGEQRAGLTLDSITFVASTDTTPINLVNVTPTAGVVAGQIPSVTTANISDATTLGRELLTAANGASALADLGLSLPISASELASVVQTNLNLAATAVQPSAIVNNADGTLSVNAINAAEPLSTVTIVTASTAPTIGQTTYYNATSGNLTPPLPALSGLRVGARLAVRRDPADVSANTVTLTCAGSDTFYSSGGTTATFPLSGEQREFQVISVAGTKYWAPAGSVNPIAALDQRYLAGASKLVSIGDNGFGSTSGSGVAGATSTAGTSEFFFTVGPAATNITAQWNHWYTSVLTPWSDTDPSGPITFSASLRVVSSTNPGTTAGQIYRFTFNGRTTVTLDPGGRVVADPLGLSLAAADVVAIRTYLSSGTAYAPFGTVGPYSSSLGGGFTSTTDLTAPGSGTISTSNGQYYGPAILLGQAQGAAKAKSVLLCGDSILVGNGDAYYITAAISSVGGFALRALRGVGGLVNAAVNGDEVSTFLTTNGSFRRLSTAQRCNSAIVEYGSNDLVASVSAATIEADNLNVATGLLRLGIGKVFLTTVLPRTTSTDGWATTTNQTPFAGETQRVAYNTWVRARCPISATTLAPVAVGTSGALLAGSFGHPITGFFDTASAVESSLNSGVWLPCTRVATGSMTASSQTLTSSTANFLTANQETGGDKGSAVMLIGAGASGANLATYVLTVNSSTQATVIIASSTAVTNAQLNIGITTLDGIHPSPHGHYLMSQAINTAML